MNRKPLTPHVTTIVKTGSPLVAAAALAGNRPLAHEEIEALATVVLESGNPTAAQIAISGGHRDFTISHFEGLGLLMSHGTQPH